MSGQFNGPSVGFDGLTNVGPFQDCSLEVIVVFRGGCIKRDFFVNRF